jgi:hypothetical protein
MQRVRADGIAHLDALDGGRTQPIADPLARPLPLEYPLAMVEWHDAWFDFDQEGPDDCRHDYLSARGRGSSPWRRSCCRMGRAFAPSRTSPSLSSNGSSGSIHRPISTVTWVHHRSRPGRLQGSTVLEAVDRTMTWKEGCRMAEIALAASPHPSGIGR